MPRVPVHREPKPPPHLRNRDPENFRHSRDVENYQHSRELDDFHHTQDYSHNEATGHTSSYSNGHANGHSNNNANNRSRRNTQNRPKRKINALTGHIVAAVGEFVGTFMFLYFSFLGQEMLVTQAAETSRGNGLASSQQNVFTALIYGFSLLVNVWAFYRISGGLFNPAVCVLTLRTYSAVAISLGLLKGDKRKHGIRVATQPQPNAN
jgi:aquaporin related protein